MDIIKLGQAIYSKIKKYHHSVIYLNILGISQKANLNYWTFLRIAHPTPKETKSNFNKKVV